MKYVQIFVFSLIVSLFACIIPQRSLAQENIIMTVSPTPTLSKTIDYTMPFPGMLPDNPLYFLKTGRDQIIGLLITDPLKKASFDLLQAEKRFQAGVMLYEQKESKKQLAFATISKGNNYLEAAISKMNDAKKQGTDIGGIQNKLLLSIKKQQQLLSDLTKSHPLSSVDTTPLIKRLHQLQVVVEKIEQSRQGES